MDEARLAVLDIDGTLTNTIPLPHASFLAAMESFALPNLDRNWAGFRHHTDTAIFTEAWERAGRSQPSEADYRIFAERAIGWGPREGR